MKVLLLRPRPYGNTSIRWTALVEVSRWSDKLQQWLEQTNTLAYWRLVVLPEPLCGGALKL
jgi:hypothetical protein